MATLSTRGDFESQIPISLYIGLEPGQHASATTVAQMLLNFEKALQEFAFVTDASAPLSLSVVASHEGSLVIKFLARLTGTKSTNAKEIMLVVGASCLTWFISHASDLTLKNVIDYLIAANKHGLIENGVLDDRIKAEIEKQVLAALRNREATQSLREMVGEAEKDEAVTGIGVFRGEKVTEENVIPRNKFRSITMSNETSEIVLKKEAFIEDTVFLVAPILVKGSKRKWEFKSAKLGKFSAAINDMEFIDKLNAGTLHLEMVPGIVFEARFKIIEENQDGFWKLKEATLLKVRDINPDGDEPRLFE